MTILLFITGQSFPRSDYEGMVTLFKQDALFASPDLKRVGDIFRPQ